MQLFELFNLPLFLKKVEQKTVLYSPAISLRFIWFLTAIAPGRYRRVIYAFLACAGKTAYARDAELRQYLTESIGYQYLSGVNPNGLSGDVGYPLNAAGVKN